MNFFSLSVMVLTMKRLSWLKKKKLPLAPEASPEEKIWSRLFFGSNDLNNRWKLIPSISLTR